MPAWGCVAMRDDGVRGWITSGPAKPGALRRYCLSDACVPGAEQPRMTMARMIKLFKLPAEPVTPGLRPMERRDIAGVRLVT